MNGSGKAGNGRGNNRRRPFRRREDDDRQEENPRDDRLSARETGSARRNEAGVKNPAGSRGGENQGRQNRGGGSRRGGEGTRGERPSYFERPKWIPPKVNTDPLPVYECPWCGKAIRDISMAIADRDTGLPVHFDCVVARLAVGERLEKGDTLSYIGGGRFGVVSFGAGVYRRPARGPEGKSAGQEAPGRMSVPSPAGRDFRIKKIIEWEDKDKRAEWRSEICDHYSVT